MSKNIHSGHRERMRKKAMNKNALEALNDHELLEILLYYSIPIKDTNPIAHDLINSLGGKLSSIFNYDLYELLKIKDIGESSAILIRLIAEIARRAYETKLDPKERLDTHGKVYRYLKPKFFGLTEECVYCLCLDNLFLPICCEFVTKGIPNAVYVSPRQVVEIAIKHKAVNIILAHNHPHNVPLPSKSDIDSTLDIKDLLEGLNMRLIDHFILSKDDYVSLQGGNWL